MLRITLHKGEDTRIRSGHPWVFSNEIRDIAGDRKPGASARLHDAGGAFLGVGYYNPKSLIAFRLLSRNDENVDALPFYLEKIRGALAYRETVLDDLRTCRVVYGEADFLPGLVVDRYGDCLSVQLLTAGMEERRELVLDALQELFSPAGIVLRNDAPVRTLEGLSEGVEVARGSVPELQEVEEHGLRLLVDLTGGQKTGHFLDQRDNHLLLQRLSRGRDVLDCFCYSGSWGMHAAAYGAASVTAVDISERAVALGEEIARLNGMEDRIVFEQEDAFQRLRSLKQEGRRFGVVVMDPPAFVKSRKQLTEAMKGYLTVNRRAMELLEEGGYLVTCSCSHHMQREMFRDLLAKAAHQARRTMRVVEVRSQGADHPVLLQVPETEYLKCFVLQAVD